MEVGNEAQGSGVNLPRVEFHKRNADLHFRLLVFCCVERRCPRLWLERGSPTESHEQNVGCVAQASGWSAAAQPNPFHELLGAEATSKRRRRRTGQASVVATRPLTLD